MTVTPRTRTGWPFLISRHLSTNLKLPLRHESQRQRITIALTVRRFDRGDDCKDQRAKAEDEQQRNADQEKPLLFVTVSAGCLVAGNTNKTATPGTQRP